MAKDEKEKEKELNDSFIATNGVSDLQSQLNQTLNDSQFRLTALQRLQIRRGKLQSDAGARCRCIQ